MFRGVSGTCQNMFRMIYFEAEDIFWKKWVLIFDSKTWPKRDAPPPPRGGGKRDRITVTNLREPPLLRWRDPPPRRGVIDMWPWHGLKIFLNTFWNILNILNNCRNIFWTSEEFTKYNPPFIKNFGFRRGGCIYVLCKSFRKILKIKMKVGGCT